MSLPQGSLRDTETAPLAPRVRDVAIHRPKRLTRRSWRYAFLRSIAQIRQARILELAASVSFFALLAALPAAVAVLSVMGLFGQDGRSVDLVLEVAGSLSGQSRNLAPFEDPLRELAQNTAAGPVFIGGLLAAIWTASGYVANFGRAVNLIYAVEEGRTLWKLRLQMLFVTLVVFLLVVIMLLCLLIGSNLVGAIGDVVGFGDEVLLAWSIGRWPLLLCVMIVLLTVLGYATPNVKRPRIVWASVGGISALFVWALLTGGLVLYLQNFDNLNVTYGSLAGVFILLLWVWLSNIAVLFGVAFDAEVERARQLQAGIMAETNVQVPARDITRSLQVAREHTMFQRMGRRLRETGGASMGDWRTRFRE